MLVLLLSNIHINIVQKHFDCNSCHLMKLNMLIAPFYLSSYLVSKIAKIIFYYAFSGVGVRIGVSVGVRWCVKIFNIRLGMLPFSHSLPLTLTLFLALSLSRSLFPILLLFSPTHPSRICPFTHVRIHSHSHSTSETKSSSFEPSENSIQFSRCSMKTENNAKVEFDEPRNFRRFRFSSSSSIILFFSFFLSISLRKNSGSPSVAVTVVVIILVDFVV